MDKFKNMLLLQLSSNLNSFCVFKEKTILQGGIFFLWRVEFFKIGKRDFMFIKEVRVGATMFSPAPPIPPVLHSSSSTHTSHQI